MIEPYPYIDKGDIFFVAADGYHLDPLTITGWSWASDDHEAVIITLIGGGPGTERSWLFTMNKDTMRIYISSEPSLRVSCPLYPRQSMGETLAGSFHVMKFMEYLERHGILKEWSAIL